MLTFPNGEIDFRSAVTMTSRAVIISDFKKPDNPIVFVNRAFADLTGYDRAECIGRNCRFLQGPDTDRQVAAEIRDAIASRGSIRREILNYRKNGEPFWNDLTIDPIRDDAGAVIGFIGIQQDSTSSRMAHDVIIEAEQRLNDITSHVPGYVYRRVLKPDGTLEFPYLSPSFNAMLGLPATHIVDVTEFYSLVHPDDLEGFKKGIARSALDLSTFHEEFRFISTVGAVHWVRSDAPARRLPNGGVVWDGLAIEITKEKTAETDLAFMAFHDSLTGLSNRVRFKNSLSDAIEAIPEEERIGVFFIDVDSFQEINEALGQAVGDEILRTIGQRLKTLAESEGGTVARLGGDEFGVFLPVMSAVGSLTGFATTISHDVTHPIPVKGREIIAQVCVGATIFPSPDEKDRLAVADASTELMKRADLALHQAKQEGPGSIRLYSVEFDDRIRNRAALRQSLRHAIEEEQFELHYHPLVQLGSGGIVGAEALVRWNHPEFGMQRPDLFIPLAEVSGLIVPLGAWVMTQAMRQYETWRRQDLTPPRIAINLSSVQLQKADFLAVVERALADTGADPSGFEFELTEGLLIEPSPETIEVLNWLKSLGFWITVDDFGTGYSTFKYLRDFPVDKIKIDQTFIRQLVVDSSDASIVRAMIGLSRSLGIKIVAEGVETEMQREFLARRRLRDRSGLSLQPATDRRRFWLVDPAECGRCRFQVRNRERGGNSIVDQKAWLPMAIRPASIPRHPRAWAKPVRKRPTGIRGFDDITGGGLPDNRLTALIGSPGAGKTVFALQTLINRLKSNGEACIFVTFEETLDRLRDNAGSFDWGFGALPEERFIFVDARLPADAAVSGAFDLSGLLAGLSALVTETGARSVVFDGVDMLLTVLRDEHLERQELIRLDSLDSRSRPVSPDHGQIVRDGGAGSTPRRFPSIHDRLRCRPEWHPYRRRRHRGRCASPNIEDRILSPTRFRS